MHNDVQLLPSKEASVARAVISDPKRRSAFEPLYDIDPQTGASIEVFYADPALANSFGRGTGWFWWTCQRGFLPDRPPTGPFATSYAQWKRLFDHLARRHAFQVHVCQAQIRPASQTGLSSWPWS